MKKQFLFLLAFAAIAFTSCKKEKTDEIKNVTLNVSINAGETYSLDLSQYGDADDAATITTQAVNYTTSEIVKISSIGTYNFNKAGTPKTGGNGNETVVLKVAETPRANITSENKSNECKGRADETNITINFTIL